MGSDDAALLALDARLSNPDSGRPWASDAHRYGLDDHCTSGQDTGPYHVKVGEPDESDSNEFGATDYIDEQSFPTYPKAREFALATARRGLKAVMYFGIGEIGVYE